MANSRKWAEQCLIEETFCYNENEKEVKKNKRCLNVCISGKELYKKEFINGKYKDKDMLAIPFDFVVVAGDMCTEGRFYELEYTIGERGVVYRSLIQAVDPVTDLQLIIGTLKHQSILPTNFKSHRAWLREDIDVVCVGSCSKDDDGQPAFYSGHKEAKDGISDNGERLSVLDNVVKYGTLGCNIYYYRGDLREVWFERECDCSKEKVFVCGVNGDDPDFAEKKSQDLEEMWEHINEASQTAKDYGLQFFYMWQDEDQYLCDVNGVGIDALEKAIESYKKQPEK